ncbi:aminomethyl-transferring glycine dehydrogenase subunit GcvPB [Candidatus Sumerlaeota bacterium]|nr:aminomethyl-transferring glycine dehydrogenase subunit GcvPB [Candidatus Sumerlaeota bacterium]
MTNGTCHAEEHSPPTGLNEQLVFEKGHPGRTGTPLPDLPAGAKPLSRLPESVRRGKPAALPEVSEPQAVRHYTRLSQKNFSIDTNFYPLGSCTMKYNPRACEAAAAMPGFSGLHPYQDAEDCQGTLAVLHELQAMLAEVVGLPRVSLTPVAGAQGEYAGVAMIHKWHDERKTGRDTVLVPDSAHGTNPASAAIAGFKVKTIKSGADGCVDLEALKAGLDNKTAALMLTNPNTCGLFEKDILEIARMVHEAGALLYYDGANLNAIVGRARPGDMGFDVVHLNLHKTFSTPHGGGGPGAGPVAVREDLAPYLPNPRVEKTAGGKYQFANGEKSIGRLHAFYGNAGVLIRAYTYTRLQGAEGLRDIATNSVLNANYLLARLSKSYEAAFPAPCKHEFILTMKKESRQLGVKAFDVAKRLLDFGIHAPTIYFPLLVPECLLIEPTENETKETLDHFIAVMEQIRREIESDRDKLTHAPNALALGRLDDVKAAKELNVCCSLDV